MKKIILLALTALMMVGCDINKEYKVTGKKDGFNIIVVDSCEYLKLENAIGYNGYGFLAHKGNCRFCKERRQKELKELVEQLRKK
jgi:hypothetical protein